ncbi:MAG: efflux RND transporter permease subunit [Candidatus Obscuribacterales bacterium]|nr:efflux RND transporter permease subunit [Candidatus Obscuribacterales bacterium]
MWIVELALRRPYTFVVTSLLIAILGIFSALRMPTDIFPFVNMPVVSVIWSYNNLPAEEMENRITTICERAITTVTSGIDFIESQSMNGISVIKVHMHQGADLGKAVGTIASLCQTLLRVYPTGTTPPLITSFSASDVPILQLGVGSESLSESELFDYGLNFIRTGLSGVPGASIPLPYGGKQRQVMVDLDQNALTAKGLSAQEVATAVGNQNIIIPSGSAKIGETEYAVKLNSTPQIIDDFNELPIKQINGATVYLKDVAQVHDGYAVQTNIVRQNGRRSTLLNVLKNGNASTIKVVEEIKKALPRILATCPPELKVALMSDQSIFVKAAIEGVVKEALTAACLTALFMFLVLASWRSTLIVAVSIPLSILASIVCLYACGQTLNTMTLGGLALAVGMLVDDATVEVENIHRNLSLGKAIERAILDGAQQVAAPAFVSTTAICIVFVPVFLLTEPARSLFVPLALAVVFAMMFSYFLSRTLVPVMARALLKNEEHGQAESSIFSPLFQLSENFIEGLRSHYRDLLSYLLSARLFCFAVFTTVFLASFAVVPFIGQDYFPKVDGGQLRLHLRLPVGTRIEESERIFAAVEDEVKQVIGKGEIEDIVDNIGLPTSGINLAYGDNITISNFDGEVLISLKEGHKKSTFQYAKEVRSRLKTKFPEIQLFFQPADIVSQILNAGLPAPIDIQVTGRDKALNFKVAQEVKEAVGKVKGAVDVTLHQIVDAPQLNFNIDRVRANQMGFTQKDIAANVLISLSSSFQTAPSFWVNPANGVNYNVAIMTPPTKMRKIDDILSMPLTSSSSPEGRNQLLSNLASVGRSVTPAVVSHYKIQNVYNIFVNVQDRDLNGVASDIKKAIAPIEKNLPRGTFINIRGQAESMNAAFRALFGGLIFALLLIYLLLVINFHSWIDPLIVLGALPGAFAGIVLALFASNTPFSVPALMGAIMSIGVASANSILLVTFANERLHLGDTPVAAALMSGYTRIRPVLMTATAMILGMLPMALGLGEGGSQNAPLGRAVIGGLILATVTTLLLVPCLYSLVKRRPDDLSDMQDGVADQQKKNYFATLRLDNENKVESK